MKHFQRLCTCFLYCVALWPSGVTHAQVLDFRCFSQGAGLTASGVYQLEEDRIGRLLLATEGEGLIRFDGKNFEVWNHARGFPVDTVRCLMTDNDGTVYLGSDGRGVWSFDGEVFKHIPSEINGNTEVRALAKHPDGSIMVGTLGQGLFRLYKGEINKVTDFPGAHIRSLMFTSDSAFFIGTDNGIFHYNDEGYHQLQPTDSTATFGYGSILCFYEDEQGDNWAGTTHGPIRFNNREFNPANIKVLEGERVRSIAQDAQGDIWFGTQNGLFELEQVNGIVHHYTMLNGLSNNRIRNIFRDRSGSLWCSTFFGGVCQLAGQEVVHFNRDQGFPESLISALLLPNDSSVWLGTYDGGVYRYTETAGATKVYQTRSGFQQNTVQNIELDHQTSDVIAISTEHDGIMYFSESASPKQAKPKEIAASYFGGVIKIIHDTPGKTIIGKAAATYKEKQISAQMIGVERFTDGHQNDTALVLGSHSGLFIISERMILESGKHQFGEKITPVAGSEKLEISAIAIDRTGQIWIGTARSGLYRYSKNKLKQIAKRNLPDERILGMALDPMQDLWVVTPKGLTHLELDPTQELILGSEDFGPEQGLQGQLNGNTLQWDFRGQLWIGSTRGLFRISPLNNYVNPIAPGLILSDVRLNYEAVNWRDYDCDSIDNGLPAGLSLAHTENHLTFDFKGIDLSDPGKIIYQVRLEGYDPGWIDLGDRRTQTYPKLPPGEFTFQLRGRNSNGIWNETPLSFSFKINPPFYASPWFILFLIVTTGGLIYLFVRWRLSTLEERNKLLDIAVKQRTHELKEEKEKSDRLLLNILPKETADELKENGSAVARSYKQASVLFSDIKGFTMMTEKINASELVGILDDAFKAFDRNCDLFGVEKIKTIGDAYMCAAGIPAEDDNHATKLVQFALAMIRSMEKLNQANVQRGLPKCELRVGIHSGPLIAGVVGEKKFAYDIWGDTVNTAARMESSGAPGKVNISASTYELVKNDFICVPRGMITAKNKGELEMYFVSKERAT